MVRKAEVALPVVGRDANPTVVFSYLFECKRCHMTLQSNNVLMSAHEQQHTLTQLWCLGGRTPIGGIGTTQLERCQATDDAAGRQACIILLGDAELHCAWLAGFHAGNLAAK